MVTVPGVMVIQVAKKTRPQLVVRGGSMMTKTGFTREPEKRRVFATDRFDCIMYITNKSKQRAKRKMSLKERMLGRFNPRSYQSQTIINDRNTPTAP